jgi:hypothetical protein
MLATAASVVCAYTLGPAALQHAAPSVRAEAPLMADYRLNNYILPGPMKPLNNQVRTPTTQHK